MTHASVFSGIGGPEVAADMLGWNNLFHCEIEDFKRKILEYWYPNEKSYKDITTTDFSEWRGNDGIPFSLDDLTIPEGKWRRGSLESYGDAIVPQVMYMIFQAIERVECAK